MCPFCYIGKRHFEAVLGQFSKAAEIELEWHSFQLDPTIPRTFEKRVNVYEYLANRKGISYEQSKSMHVRIIQMAKDAGLTYNFDKAIVANSFDAHKVIQLAKTKGLGDAIEERLFLAYFTEGKDFGNHDTLIELGKEIGLTKAEVINAIESDEFAYKVKQDIQEAQHIGVTGVPFFVFDRKYAVSGAQPATVFTQTLEKSFSEWRKINTELVVERIDGSVCKLDGECN